MEELCAELLKVWPKTSEWPLRHDEELNLYFFEQGSDETCLDPEITDDLQNSFARTIIEDELSRAGFLLRLRRQDDAWGVSLNKGTGVCGSGTEQIGPLFCNTRTEALLRVAIQAFSTGTEGDNKG